MSQFSFAAKNIQPFLRQKDLENWFCGVVDNCGWFTINKNTEQGEFELRFDQNLKQKNQYQEEISYANLLKTLKKIIPGGDIRKKRWYICFTVTKSDILEKQVFPLLYNYTNQNTSINPNVRYKLLTSKYWDALLVEKSLPSSKRVEWDTGDKRTCSLMEGCSPFFLELIEKSSEWTQEAYIQQYAYYIQNLKFNGEILSRLSQSCSKTSLQLIDKKFLTFLSDWCFQEYNNLLRNIDFSLSEQNENSRLMFEDIVKKNSSLIFLDQLKDLFLEKTQQSSQEYSRVLEESVLVNSLKREIENSLVEYLVIHYTLKKKLKTGKELKEISGYTFTNLDVEDLFFNGWLTGFFEHGLQVRIKRKSKNQPAQKSVTFNQLENSNRKLQQPEESESQNQAEMLEYQEKGYPRITREYNLRVELLNTCDFFFFSFLLILARAKRLNTHCVKQKTKPPLLFPYPESKFNVYTGKYKTYVYSQESCNALVALLKTFCLFESKPGARKQVFLGPLDAQFFLWGPLWPQKTLDGRRFGQQPPEKTRFQLFQKMSKLKGLKHPN